MASDSEEGRRLRPELLCEASRPQLREYAPNVAVLPWGATEAHGSHLPYTTDNVQAEAFAARAAAIARERGARPVVLPVVPFGSNAQQLDQVATCHLSVSTVLGVLRDVVRSMTTQGIDRLLIVNSHGGNEFRPFVRDLQFEFKALIVVADFWRMRPELRREVFDVPGDHADESEASLLLHLRPDLVRMADAGRGERLPFRIEGLSQPGVWTPRPWAAIHPDTGSGDPRMASADKGRRYFEGVSEAIAEVIVGLSRALPGDVPYFGGEYGDEPAGLH